MVQQLGVRHAGYGVMASHYDSVRQALLYTLAVILQDEYTDEVRSAWASAYAMLAGIMKEAAWGAP
jgi:hemoglobin-like flavoprotein